MLSDLAAPLFPPHPPEVSDTDSWPPETSPAADCLPARPGRRSSESRLSTGAARYCGEAGEAGAGGKRGAASSLKSALHYLRSLEISVD